MKLKRISLSLAVATALTFGMASCGPKDADIKSEIESKLSGNSGVNVDVKDGVATLSGTFMDEASKAAAEAAAKTVKGVKSVVDNATVPPPPAPVMISPDDALKNNVSMALKNYSGLMADVSGGVVTLTGQIKKTDLPKVMMAMSALHPKKIVNKATITK